MNSYHVKLKLDSGLLDYPEITIKAACLLAQSKSHKHTVVMYAYNDTKYRWERLSRYKDGIMTDIWKPLTDAEYIIELNNT